MRDKKFDAILFMLVGQLVGEIIAYEGIGEQDAIDRFYRTKLYATLEREETKLWHLSPRALYELYREEQESGKITFPVGG